MTATGRSDIHETLQEATYPNEETRYCCHEFIPYLVHLHNVPENPQAQPRATCTQMQATELDYKSLKGEYMHVTSALQLVLVELCEFSEDVSLLVFC